ncbi:MAG: glycosyl hydrolase 115 family protein [Sedimentisphaerales bacterium]|nr:glycosyl hydrolase 115 family protein [Sedimentisphaerales bacterium]
MVVFGVIISLVFQAGIPGIQVTGLASPEDMAIVGPGHVVRIIIDPNEDRAVQRAGRDLVEDIGLVTGRKPQMVAFAPEDAEGLIVIGTIPTGRLIRTLVRSGRLDAGQIVGRPESYVIQTVQQPVEGVEKALVIAGSDRRGAIYGIYTLSEAIGVSPWYWWADVPIQRRPTLAIRPVKLMQGPPAVRYRGIFINDEGFGLRPWAAKTFDPEFGNIGPRTYGKVFELLLRLKANLLWPAMHEGTIAFNRIPENRELADQYGIIIGSSHCEQMLRNNVDEWGRDGRGEYNYVTNRDAVLAYWEARVKEFAKYEGIYTVGMRGIHDSGMPGGGSPTQQAQRLHQIIADQRGLLSRYVNEDLTKVPQMFCPYKEVLALYRLAPEIPQDITICWPDDNWGYIRQFCNHTERARSGGAGVYYHISYWGLPYDYLWLCSTPPTLIWEEMTKAFDYGADRIWVVNVGDIKPAEIGLEFFLRLAWDPHRYGPSDINDYLVSRFCRDFGPEYGKEMAAIMQEYYRLCLQRRPEHMGIDPRNRYLADPGFAVMLNGDEAKARLEAFKAIAARVDRIAGQLPAEYKDAFFQLVAYPVKAACLMNEKGLCISRFKTYAAQGRACAARYLQQAWDAYRQIQDLTEIYNNKIASGKWRGMMSASPRDLPIFGPPQAGSPQVPDGSILGVAVEGSDAAVFGTSADANMALPRFSRFTQRRYFVDVFDAGKGPSSWTVTASEDWIVVEPKAGTSDHRLWVGIDWQGAPKGPDVSGHVMIESGPQRVRVDVSVFNPDTTGFDDAKFVEDNGLIVIEAEHASHLVPGRDAAWQIIDGLGYNGQAVCIQPFLAQVLTDPVTIASSSPRMEYNLWVWQPGNWHIEVRALPTFSVQAGQPQRVAVGFDDELPRIVAFPLSLTERDPNWQQSVLRNMAIATSTHLLERPGRHVLKIWMVDPGIVIDSIVAYIGDRPRLGYTLPPETILRR